MIKIYEPVIDQETGKIKIETELDPAEIKHLLGLAIMLCLQQGIAPTSIAHHFGGGEEVEKVVEAGTSLDSAASTPNVEVKTPDQLTEQQQLDFLKAVDPKSIPQA